jgi:3-oxoacyl-[acyl-carrier protein] reductase
MLKDRWVLITGASKGIGKATAREFAKNGANLLLVARDKQALQALHNELQTSSYIFICDISTEVEIKQLFVKISKITKTIDVLINNAGILYSAPLLMSKRDEMEKLFATNFYSVMHMSQYASRMMLRQKKGSIVNLSSVMGIEGAKNHTAYSASKASLIALSKSLSKELAPFIRVNVVAPGVVETSLIESLKNTQREKIINTIPLQRFAKDIEIAQTILFLASDMSSFITGEVLRVDGGLCSIEI